MLKWLALLVVASVVGAMPQATHKNEGTEERAQNSEPDKRDKRGTKDAPLIVEMHPEQSDKEAAKEQERIRKQESSENWTIWLTLAIAVAAFLQFGGIIAQIRIYRRQEKHMVASERAWILVELKCDPTALLAHGDGEEGQTTAVMDVELHCTNHGSSPAWITVKSARLVNTRELPPIPQLTKEDIITEVLEPIGPDEESIEKWTPSGKGHYSPLNSALIV